VPRLVGINHVAVVVDDIDEELAFLTRVFDDVTLRGRSASMAFVDLGDQFIALARGKPRRDGAEHVGLVVDDREETLRRADPSGNVWQIVDYSDIQFTKAPRVLEGMGMQELEKSAQALEELRSKGLAD